MNFRAITVYAVHECHVRGGSFVLPVLRALVDDPALVVLGPAERAMLLARESLKRRQTAQVEDVRARQENLLKEKKRASYKRAVLPS